MTTSNDICKCCNMQCPLNVSCWRYQMPVKDGAVQSYALFQPHRLGDCAHYMPMDEVETTTTTTEP